MKNLLFKGIKIHSCSKIPESYSIQYLRNFRECPWCGEEIIMSFEKVDFPDGKGYTRNGSPTFYALLESMANIHDKKSHDYASNANPFANYQFAGMLSKVFDNPDDAGFIGRIGEKLYRLANLENNGKTPSNESIEDTEIDLCTIMVLWMASRRERRMKSPKESYGPGDISKPYKITDVQP